LATKKVEETVTAETPKATEETAAKLAEEKTVESIEFAHKFLFATYDLGFSRVDFCNGMFATNDPRIIEALRKSPDMGQELVEIGKKV
jgi:hypothetical protein